MGIDTKSNDLVGRMMAYEDGTMNKNEIIEFFQELIDEGIVWSLQGHYGRTANSLIENGLCFGKD
jgi:hypothetical protein